MKIGISATSVYNINKKIKNSDGIGAYTANLCQALIKQNITVKEIYFKKLQETLSTTDGKAENFYLAQNPLLSLASSNLYRHFKNKIDLLHVTDYLVPRIKSVPTITSIHDATILKHPEWWPGFRPLTVLKGRILKTLARQADYIITCSQSNVADIERFWGIPATKIAVIHLGLSEIWWQKIDPLTQQAVLKKYRLTRPFFLTVGTLQIKKNLERVINAYISLPSAVTESFNLVIVGKAHASVTPPLLLEKIQRLEQSGRLVWLQYVPFADLRSLYQSAHLLLFPSLEEGFGFPILEGFASEIPVITSHCSSMAEIAGAAAYLVDPYAEDSIRTAMLDIIEKPDLRAQLIQRGSIQVKSFTWETCAKNTIEIYKKFL